MAHRTSYHRPWAVRAPKPLPSQRCPQTISYRSTLNTLSTEYSSPPCVCVFSTLPTSTLASEPAATKPTLTGKKASASPSHLNSSEPLGASAEMEGMVHVNEVAVEVQSASSPEVREGRELGLSN